MNEPDHCVGSTSSGAAQADRATQLKEFDELLAIPNVATSISDNRRNADHIRAMMEKRGLKPHLLEGDGADVPPAIATAIIEMR